MAKTLSELIADAASADDLVFTGPGGETFKLSDVRGFHKAVDGETQIAKMRRVEAENAAKEAAQILAALQEAQKQMNAAPSETPENNDADAWKKDPLYAPIVPVFEGLLSRAAELQKTVESTKKALDFSQAVYATERLRRQWAEASVKPKDRDFDSVVKEILEAKEVDAFGLPTMERYLHRATEPDRIKAASDAAVAAAKVEWDKTAKAAAVPKPGQFRARVKPAEAPIKNLSELTSETIANDPDILAAMEAPTN
jgi:hypothetical protein